MIEKEEKQPKGKLLSFALRLKYKKIKNITEQLKLGK
jgi:hypothetical protein